MHHIHHTHGFILSSRNTGEANKILTVYTREMGLIRAVAQGVRLHKSKLRFSLQDFSYIKVDFVKGKEFWRITSASSINAFPTARANKFSLILINRISKLIERLCFGESPNEKVFDEVIKTLYLLEDENLEKEYKEALEIHIVLSIMNYLGYIGDSLILSKYLYSSFDNDKKEMIILERKSIIAYINKALNESQL